MSRGQLDSSKPKMVDEFSAVDYEERLRKQARPYIRRYLDTRRIQIATICKGWSKRRPGKFVLFLFRVIKVWNDLPANVVVNSPMVNTFRGRLEEFPHPDNINAVLNMGTSLWNLLKEGKNAV